MQRLSQGLDSFARLHRFGLMPAKSRTKSPKETIKVNRLPRPGEEITLRARVTRTGRNGYDTGDTITVRIPGYPAPVTINAAYLNQLEDVELGTGQTRA